MILPSLYSELKGPALPNIIKEISKVKYLNNIVIGLDKANEEEFKEAKEFFSQLPQKYEILWNDGPNLRALDAELAKQNLAPQEMGKEEMYGIVWDTFYHWEIQKLWLFMTVIFLLIIEICSQD